MALATGTRLGRYELLAQLGAGGMGEVYRARDTRLDRDVAIKVLPERFAEDPDALARFQREGKAAAALSHPNIRGIYDISTDQGCTFAVMELLEGDTLAGRLKRTNLDWREAVQIGLAIANGLGAAHAKGIIHRDIKPANIFLDVDGGVKVLDFGLARLLSKPAAQQATSESTVSLETHAGTVMGTLFYMSPEQARGLAADARSDVFSFGCMLYEMVTGQRPFGRPTQADSISAILHEDPPTLAALAIEAPAELDALIARCLQKAPDQRFQSGRDLAAALKTLSRQAETGEAAKPRPGESTMGAKPTAAASIAVLPFVNMSSDKENEYFSDGLAEELINALTKVEGLRVASRPSAFAFKNKNEDVRKIGEQLHVGTVLVGSVRKAGNRLRIAAQLVSVADDSQLWSETYNRQLEDVFAIQDEITQHIVKALRVMLTDKEKRAIEQAPAANVQAYEYYLRGRQFFHQLRRKSLEFARQMFARAIAIDPGYARAYAGLADCHSYLYTHWDASAVNLQDADKASRKALELDPDLAEAHTARGFALSLSKQYEEAHAEFETAIRQNPNLFEAYYLYARASFTHGKLVEAARLYEQASRVRPDDYQAPFVVAPIYIALGRNTEAEAADRRGLQVAERHLELHPEDVRALYLGAQALCRLGERLRSLEWAGRALAMDPEEPVTLYNIACVYSLQGQSEEAMDCLEKAIKHGFVHKGWIEHDSDLNSLRNHPRFQALLAKL